MFADAGHLYRNQGDGRFEDVSALLGAQTALTENEKRGAILFYGQAGCVDCHSGNLMTDQDYHNMAVPHIGPGKGSEAPLDYSRARETGDDCDLFAFRTPPLRNVAITEPWMHNGTYTDLRDVVLHNLDPLTAQRIYQADQLDPELRGHAMADESILDAALACQKVYTDAIMLSEQEFDNLIALLNSLTSPAELDVARLIPERVPSGLAVGGY